MEKITQQDIMSIIEQRMSGSGIKPPMDTDINFWIESEILKIKLLSKGLFGNMQEDCSAFEGWAFCIKSLMPNNLIKKVELIWDDEHKSTPYPTKTETQHYARFKYRVWKFLQNYHNWVETTSYSFDDYNTNDWVLNYPTRNAKEDAANEEAKIEREYVKKARKNEKYDAIDHQLPVGVFNGVKSKCTTIMPRNQSKLDIWAIKGEELCIFELKTIKNQKIGIISELMFYANLMSDLVNKRVRYPDEAKNYYEFRSLGELHRALDEGQIKKVTGCFLTDKLHPLITNDVIARINDYDSPSKICYFHQLTGIAP